jgi:tRNA U34 2-thiouridine synthase MnmA/TrmU
MRHKTVDNVSFIHSHEILFGQKIYLKDYCKCITYLLNPRHISDEESKKRLYSEIKKIEKACSILNIPFKQIDVSKDYPMKGIGINHFIKKVEQ